MYVIYFYSEDSKFEGIKFNDKYKSDQTKKICSKAGLK